MYTAAQLQIFFNALSSPVLFSCHCGDHSSQKWISALDIYPLMFVLQTVNALHYLKENHGVIHRGMQFTVVYCVE